LVACAKDLNAALGGLLNSARGIDTADLEKAERTLASEAKRIGKYARKYLLHIIYSRRYTHAHSHTLSVPASAVPKGDFSVVSSQLVATSKALQAALTNVVFCAETDPGGLCSAAQMASVAVTPFVNSANATAGMCADSDAAGQIMKASRDMVSQ